MPGMQNPKTNHATPEDPQEQETERAINDAEADLGGPFADAGNLFSVIGESIQGTARLLGLEALLVVKTVVSMVALGVLLGLVLVGIWFSITAIVAAGLYEYTRLSMTLSVAGASLINVACAWALFLMLKRRARRLSFPETRAAVRTLLADATRAKHPREQEEQKQE